jgi:hypothetical protein
MTMPAMMTSNDIIATNLPRRPVPNGFATFITVDLLARFQFFNNCFHSILRPFLNFCDAFSVKFFEVNPGFSQLLIPKSLPFLVIQLGLTILFYAHLQV